MSHPFPEYSKPHVDEPFITSISAFSPEVLTQIQTQAGAIPTQIGVGDVSGISTLSAGGIETQTPGAVSTVDIAHGFGHTPSGFIVQPASANARAAPSFYLSADDTNITMHFSANLTAATSYVWVWAVL